MTQESAATAPESAARPRLTSAALPDPLPATPEILLTAAGGTVLESQPDWRGFAIVDVETTGGWPHRGDRVLEVAVVQMTFSGEIETVWHSLTDPGRAPGPTAVHGIHSDDLLGAPAFRDVAGELRDLFAARTVVAHNAVFDLRFLRHEFARAGTAWEPPSVLCTLQLARRLRIPRPWRLSALAQRFKVPRALKG